MTQMNQHAEDIKIILAKINAYLGDPGPVTPVSPRTDKEPLMSNNQQPRKSTTLHLMYDTERKSLLGVSIGGKIISGAVAAHLSREGISLLDSEGEDLLGTTKAAIGDSRATRIQQDIIDWLNGGGE
jgi:hypothetical protein